MSDKSSATSISGGISTTGLLGVLFVGLKLTGYITWSWWWVLAPFWLPLAVVFGFLLGALAASGLVVLVSFIFERLSK